MVTPTSGRGLTSAVSGEVEQKDVGAEAAQVVQRLQVLLQLPVGQFALEDGRQVSEHVGVQRRRPAGQQTVECDVPSGGSAPQRRRSSRTEA